MAQTINPRQRFARALSFHLFAMAGCGTSDVAAEFGISTAGVCQWCDRNRLIATRAMLADNGNRCLTDNQCLHRIETIQRCRDQGLSWGKTAEIIGIHISGLYYWMQRYSDRYPQLVKMLANRRSEQEYRENIRARKKRIAEWKKRPKDWKLTALLDLKLMLQSGYSMNSAALACNKSNNYFHQVLIRLGFDGTYSGVVEAVSYLWEIHRPGQPEPEEYHREPRLCMRLINDAAADTRVEWHFERWSKMESERLKHVS